MDRRRRRRALIWTLGIAAILAGPLAYRMWLESDAASVAMPKLGDVEPFVYHDANGQPLTREILRRGVSIIVHIPKICENTSCGMALEQARVTEAWIKNQLMIGYTEEKNPLYLLATGGGFHPTEANWHVINEEISEGSILPRGYKPDQSWLVVIDPWLSFAGVWDLSKPIEHRRLERVLSRTTFEQYMGNYLARRTFMGPKRDAR